MSSVKQSPFVLTQDSLERLKCAAIENEEPAVIDLIAWYTQAADSAQEFATMITAEMEHFGVS